MVTYFALPIQTNNVIIICNRIIYATYAELVSIFQHF